ncbi:MAG TPA: hypothetical protein PLN05_08495 [Pyrinomonadaceae bacterium]|nr:hypothetical protein [Chloracidobacterium sp.]HRJ88499.1 hypothetical protein [Pyrinomonadaceae bacterium]HRK50452.1 hypothetical protein [Pyrinomonadaceae bacterium]
MKIAGYSALLAVFGIAASASTSAQGVNVGDRKFKVVVSDTVKVKPATAGPKAVPTPMVVGRTRIATEPKAAETLVSTRSPSTDDRSLSFREIKSKIAEAKRQMQTRPIATSSVGSVFEGIEIVRIAFHDWRSDEIDYAVITKEAFLSTAEDKVVTSQNGRNLTIRTIRGNGVNTPITVTDNTGMQHLPLMVQYPVVRNGKYIETAYYMSTHPGLVTTEVVNAGRIYVRNVIEIARERLRSRGILIQPKTADIAERLAAVEHVDHLRFRTEPHKAIYDDVYTLFALNEGQTYRYAVSSAGAGGMVQMIPSTYRMVRAQFPQVPLMPDFVEGMRDHVNAAQAMLLYMQWTWDDLRSRPAISSAILSGIAKQEQLMAAGYNSNPARLAGYIDRGGPAWTNLIPRETKIYLQIYESVERHVPMNERTR